MIRGDVNIVYHRLRAEGRLLKDKDFWNQSVLNTEKAKL